MLNYIKSFFQRKSEGGKMNQKIMYIVKAEVEGNDPGDLKRKLRQIRADIKTSIAAQAGCKAIKIQTKME